MRAPRPISPRTARLAAAWVIAILACQALPVVAGSGASRLPTSDRIRLAAGYTLDPSAPDAAPAPEAGPADAPGEGARAGIAAGPAVGPRTLLVHYGDADPAAARAAIEASGARVVSAIADRAFLVRVPGGRVVTASGPLDWVAPYQPAYKLSPALARMADSALTLDVRLFGDADLATVARSVAGFGGQVLLTSDNGINRLLRLSLPRQALPGLAALDAVAWVEPHRQAVPANDRVQWVVQSGVNGDRAVR